MVDSKEVITLAYTYEGMRKISLQQAIELYDNDNAIYVLYPDNSESLIQDRAVFDESWLDEVEFGIEIE